MNSLESNKKLDDINNVGIILRPDSPNLYNFYLKIESILLKYGLNPILDSKSALMINKNKIGIEFNKMCQDSDFIISIGGDGTLISLIRESFQFDKPILGVNLGNLGFLTDTQPDEIDKMINNIIYGKYRIDNRMLIEASLFNNKNIFAVNDIVIKSANRKHMVKVKAKIDDELFNIYYGDGVIISTPTGSTAYNLSLGGPVVYPLTEAFIVTPLSSHSLTQRPLVLPARFTIEFEIDSKDGGIAIIDGQDEYLMKQNSKIKITVSKQKARLIHRLERNYFTVLREKLHWGSKW